MNIGVDSTLAPCYNSPGNAVCLACSAFVLVHFLSVQGEGTRAERTCGAAIQADVAERYTRLSQKQVPQGLRVRISPSAPLTCYATSKATQ